MCVCVCVTAAAGVSDFLIDTRLYEKRVFHSSPVCLVRTYCNIAVVSIWLVVRAFYRGAV